MASITAQAQEARIKRSMRNDRIATGILTFIVGLVIVIVVSMVLYILAQGIGQLHQAVEIGSGKAGFPFRDGLPGNTHALGEFFLRHPQGFAPGLYFSV